VTVCDNSGVELFDAAFPDMYLVPQAPYNINCLTQRMEHDWRLSGDNGSINMCFDIRIETAKGVLWVACLKRKMSETSSFKDKDTSKVTGVWRLMVFYPSQLKITDIFKTKNGMVETTVEKLSQMIQLGIGVLSSG
jgi:hypothetical protein